MEITKEELEKLYYSNTNEELCKILSVSKPTLIKYLSIAGIELKGKGGTLKKVKLI